MTGEPGYGRSLYKVLEVFSGGASCATPVSGLLGPVRRCCSVDVIDEPWSSALELLGFAGCVAGVLRVFIFQYPFILNGCGLEPDSIIGFRTLNHPAWTVESIADTLGVPGLCSSADFAARWDLRGSHLSAVPWELGVIGVLLLSPRPR